MNITPTIRLAANCDLDDLVGLENKAFASDRFTRKQIEYLLTEARSTILLLEHKEQVIGVSYLLWRSPNRAGRIYNIAIDPEVHGQGLGTILLKESELEAARRRCRQLLLEVRVDNEQAITFYKKYGYEIKRRLPGYYDDGAPGFKMVKNLDVKVPDNLNLQIPYFHQTLDFTCGAACVMMILKYFHPEMHTNRTLELNLWKEATQIFLTSGIGGTDPFGLALTAFRRGHQSKVILSKDQTPFFASVRKEDKRQVLKLMHNDYRQKAIDAGIGEGYFDFTMEDIISGMFRGMIPIVLISTYRLSGDRVPHWVVITGFDSKHIFFHDPDMESYQGKKHSPRNVRISQSEFDKMRRYGKDLYKSVIFIGQADHKPTRQMDGSDLEG